MDLAATIRKTRNHPLFDKYHQPVVNIYIFLNIAGFMVWNYWKNWDSEHFDFIEIAYLLHNILMIVLFLVRRNYKSIDNNLLHQAVATFAFFSGLAFIGQQETDNSNLLMISQWFIGASWVIGIVTLLNLGRSFGVLIAHRQIKTSGLYSIVRHPMYLTDIMFRFGFIISHFNALTIILFVISVAAYVFRAVLEERFLSQTPEYRFYMTKVRFRFIPYIF